jgi:hypothetical protein
LLQSDFDSFYRKAVIVKANLRAEKMKNCWTFPSSNAAWREIAKIIMIAVMSGAQTKSPRGCSRRFEAEPLGANLLTIKLRERNIKNPTASQGQLDAFRRK